jgi:lipocalin
MLKVLATIALVFCAFIGVQSETDPGSCENVQVMSGFNPKLYLGLWYEIARFSFLEEDGGVCDTANYSLNADGSVHVLNSQRKGAVNGPVSSATGRATVHFFSNLLKFRFPTPLCPLNSPFLLEALSVHHVRFLTHYLHHRLDY